MKHQLTRDFKHFFGAYTNYYITFPNNPMHYNDHRVGVHTHAALYALIAVTQENNSKLLFPHRK